MMWDLEEDNLFLLLGGSFRQKQERYSEQEADVELRVTDKRS